MDKDLESLKKHIMDEEMIYLKADEGFWIQKDGKFLHLSQMSESHLRNSIKRIEKDIERLESRPIEIFNELSPLAEDKIEELKSEYRDRI